MCCINVFYNPKTYKYKREPQLSLVIFQISKLQSICYSKLKKSGFYLDKVVPIMVRGFRQRIQGQQSQKHRLLNQSTLRIFRQLQKNKYAWNKQMTNQMLGVNGLKYIFSLVNQSPIDDLIEMGYEILIMITKQKEMVSFMISFNVSELILKKINKENQFIIHVLELLRNLLGSEDFIRAQKSFLQFRSIVQMLKDDDQQVVELGLDCLQTLIGKSSLFIRSLNKIEAISIFNGLLMKVTDSKLLKKLASVYGAVVSNLEDQASDKFIKTQLSKVLRIISEKNISDQRFVTSFKIILRVSEQISERNDLDEGVIATCFQVYELYESLGEKTRWRLNKIVDVIFERNKDAINKFSSDEFISNLVQSYKFSGETEQMQLLLRVLLFQSQQKRTTQILRAGRQHLIDKLLNDCMSIKDYQVAVLTMKNLLALARQKYIQKFVNIKIIYKIVNKVLRVRGEEEYLGLVVSVIYFISKNEQVSALVVESKAVERVSEVMVERHDKEALLLKCFALLELLHTTNYKKKVLNYFLSSDPKLQITKTFNYILRRAQNKPQMGARAVFYYDFLLSKPSIQSLTILMDTNDWMIEDLISTRNQYIGKVDSLVYKIQLILNNVCQKSKKLNKIYQRFKIAGDISSGDEAH